MLQILKKGKEGGIDKRAFEVTFRKKKNDFEFFHFKIVEIITVSPRGTPSFFLLFLFLLFLFLLFLFLCSPSPLVMCDVTIVFQGGGSFLLEFSLPLFLLLCPKIFLEVSL